MATTSSGRGLTIPTVAGDNNAWGAELNSTITALDTILGGSVTLYSSNNPTPTLTSSQAQIGNINCISSAAMTVTFAGASFAQGNYRVVAGSNAVTCTTGSGTTTVVPAGTARLVNVTGVNCAFADNPPTGVGPPGPTGPPGPPGGPGGPPSPPNYSATAGGLAFAQASPSDPVGTSGAAMMGLGGSCTITTSTLSGRLEIEFHFDASSTGSGDATTTQLRYGTGGAPSNGSGASGTALGQSRQTKGPAASAQMVCSLGGILAGAISTTYWFDILLTSGGGTAIVKNIDFMSREF